MRRRLRRLWALLAAVVLCALAGPSAAADRPGTVEVSSDGVHWSAGLSASLFDPAVRWVPGDHRVASFYVRNGGPSPAALRLGVHCVGDDLVRTGDVQLSVRADGNSWVRLVADRPSAVLEVQPASGRSRVDVRAVFDPASTNRSQHSTTDLSFMVRLTQATTQPGGDYSGLADTGTLVRPSWLLAGIGLVVLGLALVRRRRGEARDG